MSHEAQRAFFGLVKAAHPSLFQSQRVLEVGSLDINGSIRDLFDNCDYLGVDVGAGRGVDLVCPGEDLPFDDGTFDISVSGECFEHNPAWRETFANMVRMTKPGGIIAFSCASTGRPEHGTTRSNDAYSSPLTVALGQEYYRNLTIDDFTADDLTGLGWQTFYNGVTCDLYFAAIKGASGMTDLPWRSVNWNELRG